jgi:multiple sugar transport system permease protein
VSAAVSRRPGRSRRRTNPVTATLRGALLVLAITVSLVPIVWIVLTSFKPEEQWVSDPPAWIPSEWSFDSYRQMWDDGGGRSLLNSVVVVGLSTVAAMVIGALAAYSFSRFRTGGRHLVAWILSIKFLPPVVFAVPLLIMFTENGLYDRRLGLILLYTTFQLPFVIWMLKGFFDEVPDEIEDSARVDGCSWLGVFVRFTLPMSAPGLVATALLTFVFGWSEFFLPLVFASQDNYPLTVQLSSYFSEAVGLEWGPQAALSVVGMLPMLLAAVSIQRYLIRGMTFGAVKG